MESGAVLAILVLTLVHFGAFALLFWHLAGREILGVFRIDSGDDPGPRRDDPAPEDPRGPRDGGVPLPDAAPAPVRLREPGRIADWNRARPPRPRRPEHVPGEPERTPAI